MYNKRFAFQSVDKPYFGVNFSKKGLSESQGL